MYGKAHFCSLGSVFSSEIIEIWKQNILKQDIGYYYNAPLIARIGMAFYESIGNNELKNEYYKNANRHNERVREICFPYISPIDLIISLLDTIWNKGCKRAIFEGNKAFAGLVRVLSENSSIEPHQDIFKRDSLTAFNDNPIKEQIAFNCFLSTAEDGGEMELWDYKPSDEEYVKLAHKDEKLSYGLDRSKVGAPTMTYTPKIGEIVLFNAGYLHAVSPVRKGQRLTLSSFIGVVDKSDELVIWS